MISVSFGWHVDTGEGIMVYPIPPPCCGFMYVLSLLCTFFEASAFSIIFTACAEATSHCLDLLLEVFLLANYSIMLDQL